MTIRTFRDANGVEWRVYTIVPKGLERRNRTDRRRGPDPGYTGPERRQQPDRRQQLRDGADQKPQAWVLPGIQGGWLVFDSGAQRRRLTPIPPGWEKATEEELEQLCKLAMV
jgi:hypothetical protein